MGRHAALGESLEIERAHRTEAGSLPRNGVWHLAPVEDGVGVGEDEPARAEVAGGRLAVDTELLDAGHGPTGGGHAYQAFSSAPLAAATPAGATATDRFLIGTAEIRTMTGRSAADLSPDDISFEHVPASDQAFENALATARDGDRLTVDDAVELLTTGTDRDGIDHERKEAVLELADRRRAEDRRRRRYFRRQSQ